MVSLYDYIYKDTARLASYYSQIWSGKLTIVEKTESSKETQEKQVKAGIKVVEGSYGSKEELDKFAKLSYDPLDMATNDILSYLLKNNYINKAYNEAKHGQLVIAHGSLFFIDRHILDMTNPFFDFIVKNISVDDNNFLETFMNFAKEFYSKVPFQTMFLLKTKSSMLTGSVIENYLSESISSFYLKHAENFLDDIHIIGIKESEHKQITLPENSLPWVGQLIIKELSKLIYPVDAIRVTPIAIFRKLNPIK